MPWWLLLINTWRSYIHCRSLSACIRWNSRLCHPCESVLRQWVHKSILSRPPGIDRSGDFLAFSPHPISGQIYEALYGTLFDFRRVYSPPDVELISSALTVPSQPQPVTLG